MKAENVSLSVRLSQSLQNTNLRMPELNQLTGLAAILTFPFDVEAVIEEDKELKGRQAKENEEAAAAI